jgi:hypothetical protein
MISSLKGFSEFSNLAKMIIFYCMYNMFVVSLTLSLVSLMAFFHFQLDHDMATIENWLQRNGWEIIIVVKAISLFFVTKLVSLRSPIDINLLQFLKKSFKSPDYYIVIIILFLYFTSASIINISPVADNQRFLFSVMLSYVGTIAFYFIDLFIILFLLSFFKIIKNKEIFMLCLSCSCLFMLTTYISVPYSRDYIYIPVISFVNLLYWLNVKNPNWSNVMAGLILLIGPISAFFGLDLIWGHENAWYLIKLQTPAFFLIMLWILAFFYSHFVRNRKDV